MSKVAYEEKILSEVRALPEGALPKVLKLLFIIKDEFIIQENESERISDAAGINHTRTKRLLSTSQRNWADDIIADREDRI